MIDEAKRKEVAEQLRHDRDNEIHHMMFYLRAATEVIGLHREELREFFMKEAREEMDHVREFSDMISYFEVPLGVSFFPEWKRGWSCGSDPQSILWEIVRMEEEVASNYALRLLNTEGSADPWIAAAHVFYEDQVKNSQTTAWEVKRWIKLYA